MKFIWLKILLFQQVLNLNTNFGVSFAIQQTIIVKEATCLKFYSSIIAKIAKSANICNKWICNHHQKLKILEKMQNLWKDWFSSVFLPSVSFYLKISSLKPKIIPKEKKSIHYGCLGVRMCKNDYYRHFRFLHQQLMALMHKLVFLAILAILK